MERRTQTHLYCLKPGDRFYFQKDKGKTVWEVQRHTTYSFMYFIMKAAWCINDLKTEQRFKASRVIVFLRNTFLNAA